MKQIILAIGAYFLLTAATCTTAQQIQAEQISCAVEANAHAIYVSTIAPNRPLAAVQKEAQFYALVAQACQSGGTLDQINAAIAASQVARTL